MELHEVGLYKEPGLAAAEPPITRIFLFLAYFGFFGRFDHHQSFRLGQQYIVSNTRVYVGFYILWRSPSCRAILHAFTVFLCVFAFGVDNQPDYHRTDQPHKQVCRVKSGSNAFHSLRKSVSQVQQFAGEVSSGRESHRLGCLIEQPHK